MFVITGFPLILMIIKLYHKCMLTWSPFGAKMSSHGQIFMWNVHWHGIFILVGLEQGGLDQFIIFIIEGLLEHNHTDLFFYYLWLLWCFNDRDS